MALVTTPGAADADSYATLVEAGTYATNYRVPTVTWWTTATDPQKEASLRLAAVLLDAMFEWVGAAVDATQARAWPRTGMLTRNGFEIPSSGATSIPVDLKNAQVEFALQLGAADRLSDNDPIRKGITSVKAGSVALTFSDVLKAANTEEAEIMLRKMMGDLQWASNTVPDSVRYLLVDTWYVQAGISRPFLFGGI